MDLRWLIDMMLPDPHFFVELGEGFREKVLLASSLEFSRAQKEAKNCRVESIEPYRSKAFKAGPVAAVAAYLRSQGISVVELHPSTPVFILEGLQREGFKVWVGNLPWFPGRLVRTEEEIGWIQEVEFIVEGAMDRLRDLLTRARVRGEFVVLGDMSLTSEYLRDFVERHLFERGCLAAETIISSGPQTAYPHYLGEGPILAHSPIIVDIFPRSKQTGRFADMTRTLFKGRPSAEAIKMYEIVLEGQRLALEMVGGHVNGKSVDMEVRNYFERAGFYTKKETGEGFIHSTGHSLNLSLHEPPSLSPKYSVRWKKNMLVTIEPGLYYPSLGLGVRVEDMVVIDEVGCTNLTNIPKDLEWAIIK